MTNKISRKVLSVVLAVVMLFSVTSIAFAAEKTDYDYPVIVVNGIDHNPLYANPGLGKNATQVFPPKNLTVMGLTVEMLISGIVAIASDSHQDSTSIMNFFVGSQLYKLLDAVQLNPDGTSASENLGPIKYDHSLAFYYTDKDRFETIAGDIGVGLCDRVGADNVYVYTYDWRIDPIESAKGLDEFIQNVKKMSRRDKVSIISEGYGSTVATSYLAECYENATADVDNFVTVNSAFQGTSLIGDLFTGRIVAPVLPTGIQSATSAFIRFTNDFSDNPITHFTTWLTNYILNNEWETQDFITDILYNMNNVKDQLYDNYLRDLLKNFTGLWAMVPVEYYEEAMDFMFMQDVSTSGDYNSEMQERLQAFKNYQASAHIFLKKAMSEGINVSVVSSWDIQLIPIGDNSASDEELFGLSAQSDGLIDTYYSSFGATTIPLNDVGAAIQNKDQRYTEGECANHNHVNAVYDYLDPEHKLGGIAHYIDASTCALPDNTWFIRDMKYGTFDTQSNSMDFLTWLVTANTSTSVFSNVLWRQFIHYNRYVKPGYLVIPDYGNLADPYLLGDVNLDGKVTPVDARLALRIATRLEKYPAVDSVVFLNADVNGDGVITAADARIILRASLGLESFYNFHDTSDLTKS